MTAHDGSSALHSVGGTDASLFQMGRARGGYKGCTCASIWYGIQNVPDRLIQPFNCLEES